MSLRIKESSRRLAKWLCFFIFLGLVSSVKALSWQANWEKQQTFFYCCLCYRLQDVADKYSIPIHVLVFVNYEHSSFSNMIVDAFMLLSITTTLSRCCQPLYTSDHEIAAIWLWSHLCRCDLICPPWSLQLPVSGRVDKWPSLSILLSPEPLICLPPGD